MSLRWVASTSVVSMLICLSLQAQSQDLDQKVMRGFVPTGSYLLSDIESINAVNGNMILRIPLVSLPPGRAGLEGGLSLVYNSAIWQASATYLYPVSRGCSALWSIFSEDSGWKYAVGYHVRVTRKSDHYDTGSCPHECPDDTFITNWKYELEFPDGSVHVLKPAVNPMIEDGDYYNVSPNGERTACGTRFDGSPFQDWQQLSNLYFYTTDGTFARLEPLSFQTSQLENWNLFFADGRRVEFRGGQQSIFDRNGNKLSISADFDLVQQLPMSVLADDEGRKITITYGTDQDTIAATGFNNAPLQWTVHYKHVTSTKSFYNYDNHSEYPNGILPSVGQLNQALRVVSQIDMPSQMAQLPYTFNYGENSNNLTDGTGELVSVTLPSTAQAAYSIEGGGGATPFYSDIIDAKLGLKTLTYSGQSETWTYNITHNGETAVIAPDGGQSSQYSSSGGLVYRIVNADGSVIERSWKQNPPDGSQSLVPLGPQNLNWSSPPPNSFVSAEYRSLYDPGTSGLTKTSIKLFDQDKNGNLLKTSEYGFANYGSIDRSSGVPAGTGNASLLRETTNTYYPGSPGIYLQQGAAQTLDSRQSSEVTGFPQGSYAEFCYDNATGTANLTLEAHWDSTKGGLVKPLVNYCPSGRAGVNSVTIVRDYTYDSYGNRLTDRDPNGVTTHYYYDAQMCRGVPVASLYPTRIASAEGTDVEETVRRSYDCNTGVITQEIDPNSVTTTTQYDPFGRPTDVVKGDTHTTKQYFDSGRYVVTRTDLDSSRKLTTIQRFDPLYRPRLTQLLENPGSSPWTDETSGIKTEYHYSLGSGGNYEVVSNPYRTTLDETMGWMRTRRDTMGRVVEVSHFSGGALPSPWGSNGTSTGSVFTVYSADTTKVTDEAGKSRQTTIDGLDRLIQVIEAPDDGNYGYVTSYAYDPLDNLRLVSQGNQTRSFAYSSLSRLLTATNPENGTINYSYDDNGNLHSRSDARTTLTYGPYDGLNRPPHKTYSDGLTSDVHYCYDGKVWNGGSCVSGGISYPVGRLTEVSSSVSKTQYGQFDSVGRILQSTQTIDGSTYQFSYGYNRNGLLTQITYPSGRQLSYAFDDANRTIGTTSTHAQSVQYAPQGAISSMVLGGTITDTVSFNPRLQVHSIQANRAGSPKLTLTYNYANNGNVQDQTIWTPDATRTQTYAYDPVNRLASANEVGSGGGSWTQNYVYDRYGNRTVLTGSYIPAGSLTPHVASQQPSDVEGLFPDNRWTSASYDPSGNIQSENGRSFTYDAENRMISAAVSGVTTHYFYDGDGRRVKKIDGYGTATYVYDAMGQLAAEYYTPTQGVPQPPTGSGTRYIIQDPLGSTRLDLASDINPPKRYDYLPFGEDLAQGVSGRSSEYPASESLSIPGQMTQRFSGKERDAESGLDYFLARYYTGAQGRFTSPDEFIGGPLDLFAAKAAVNPTFYGDLTNPQSMNKYQYGLNNPLRFIDPDGHEIKYVGGAVPPTDERVLKILAEIDELNGKRDVLVTSGLRSEEANLAGGGAKRSYHLLGMAADIRVPGQTTEETAGQAVEAGATGVSTYDKSRGRVHLDVRASEWNARNGKTLDQRPIWRTENDPTAENRQKQSTSKMANSQTSASSSWLERFRRFVRDWLAK